MIVLSVRELSALIIVAIFTASLLAGFLSPPTHKLAFIKSVRKSLTPINSSFRKLIEGKQIIYAIASLYILILYNNLKVAAINLLLGVTLIAPTAIIIFNGYMVGSFLSYGDILRNSILLLPHGVIELSAIIYSSILGLGLGLKALQRLRGRNIKLVNELRYVAERFKWVVLLLSIAAFIEVFITPLLYLTYIITTGGNINLTSPYP